MEDQDYDEEFQMQDFIDEDYDEEFLMYEQLEQAKYYWEPDVVDKEYTDSYNKLMEEMDTIGHKYFLTNLKMARFDLDYSRLNRMMKPLTEEIIKAAWHPRRVTKWIEQDFDIVDF